MYISLDWLSDYVDLSGISVEETASRLTMSTAETEGIEKVERSVDGLVVCEITSAEKMGDVTKVEVDCGGRSYTTVCGAPNVEVGLKTVFAGAGVTLATGEKIEAAERDGVKSEGVLCSAKEMGLSDWHEIIFECPPDLPNGSLLSDYIPSTDYLIEVDNKSLTHRPDLWGHYGFARELAAVFGRPLKKLDVMDLSQYDGLGGVEVSIDDDAACNCYCCIRFKTDSDMPSPLKIQRRLHALGQRTIDLMVDLTNYVMLELAQPMHAFDGKKVSSVRVGNMGQLGKFTPIDGNERQMHGDDLMIWNEEKPVAIAGVMGGLETEVTESTNEILLESANFRGANIRRTALRLNLRTDASQRFEKDQPAAVSRTALARMLRLIDDSSASLEVTSGFSYAGDLCDEVRWIELANDFFSRRAGTDISIERASDILGSIGFEVEQGGDSIRCGIPSFRSKKDVSLEVDILEEVLRIYGYDNIPSKLPVREILPVGNNPALSMEHRTVKAMTAATNCSEIHSYSWYDSNWLKKIGYEPFDVLTLKNPSASNNAIMRKELLPNILEALSRNTTGGSDARLFEVGKVYHSDSEGGTVEGTEMSGAFYRHGKVDVFGLYLELKGILEKLAKVNGLSFVFDKGEDKSGYYPWLLGGYYANISAGGVCAGKIGIVPEKIQKAVFPFGRVVWFSLDMDVLVNDVEAVEMSFSPLGAYPGSTHDFSLLWDKRKGYSELCEVLDGFSHPFIASRDFVTYYDGKGLEDNKISYTVSYLLQSEDKTLSAEDIEEFRASFLEYLDKYDISIRG